METLIDTLTFQSPINLEGSWGERQLAASATSTMALYLDKDATGFIDWECEECDVSESIGLWFDITPNGKRILVDYDGVFSLPDQAMDLLERNGIDCIDMRKSLTD